MTAPELTMPMLIVFGLLGLAVVLFIFDLLRVDLVGLLMMVLLPLTGVISGSEAIAGLSSNAVVSIIAVMIIGAGLNRTGVMNILAGYIVRIAGTTETRIMVVISATVSIISSFMQNIGAAALFLPATKRIGAQLRVPASRILMPMGFSAIIGGCLTLIGSSPLIMLNDLMASWWQAEGNAGGTPFTPLGLFSVTPVGLALLTGGLLYFAVLGRLVLPVRDGEQDDGAKGLASPRIREIYKGKVGDGFELTVDDDFTARPLGELGLRSRYAATVVAIANRDGGRDLAPTSASVVGPGAVIAMAATPARAREIAAELGWELADGLTVFAEEFSPANFGVVEAIIPPRSELTGHTMTELDFRDTYRVNPLAVYRKDRILQQGINRLKLQAGDSLLLAAPWERLHLLKKKTRLVFTEALRGERIVQEKAGRAVFFLVTSLVLALAFKVQLSIALLTGALGMVLGGVLHIDEAYRSVDWMTIFLLAGLIPLGAAFEKTGAAHFLAIKILAAIGEPTPLILMVVIALLTAVFSLVASNVGATVLMVPLAMTMAVAVGADPKTMALTVGLAASNTFLLPTHQVNALIMRPGGYKTLDFIKAGSGMTLLYLAIQVAVVSFFYS